MIAITLAAMALLFAWFASRPGAAGTVARGRPARRRRPGQPRGSGARRGGDRLPRPALLAGLQPRRRRDHDRRRAAPARLLRAAAAMIVHEDESLLVVDKPPGLVVHPAPGHSGEDPCGTARRPRGRRPRSRPSGDRPPTRQGHLGADGRRSHRGGSRGRSRPRSRPARSSGSTSRWSRDGCAPARGRSTPRSAAATGNRPGWRSQAAPSARRARTSGSLELLPADTLAEVRLETGRTHQIRAHFAAIDHPVAGDPTYGTPGRHGLGRQFLHSRRLTFRHPGERGGGQIRIAAPRGPGGRARTGAGRGVPRMSVTTSNRPPRTREGPCPGSARVPGAPAGLRTERRQGSLDGPTK